MQADQLGSVDYLSLLIAIPMLILARRKGHLL